MNKTEISEKIKNILIIILSIVLLVYTILGVNSIAHGDKFGFFNLRFYIVSSDGNNGETGATDLIISSKIKKEKVKENNTIVYKKDNKVYVNKVVSEKDNGLYVESDNINDVEVTAKVIWRVKEFGNMAIFIKSPIGVFNTFMILICIAIIAKKIKENSKNTEENN